MKIVKSPYLSEKSSDFDEIWYTASDIEPGYSHVTKNCNFLKFKMAAAAILKMQHCRFQAGLLQCTVEWRTGSDFRQATACPEQPGHAESSAGDGVATTPGRCMLHSLHWLLVRQRVTYKLAVLTHKVRTTATPTYLSELVQTRAPPQALRSSDARCS